MPELPEVQTVVNQLQQIIISKVIKSVEINVPQLVDAQSKKNSAFLEGARIKGIRRVGKNIVIECEDKKGKQVSIAIHLKMTGHLLVGKWKKKNGAWVSQNTDTRAEKVNSYIRVMIHCTDGTMVGLSDARKFARIIIASPKELDSHRFIQNIGVDALSRELSAKSVHKKTSNRAIPIKQTLLDQTVIAGIGNIYADEILYEARIHPRTQTKNITIANWENIIKTARAILKKSIAVGGASMSDYRDIEGRRGGYSDLRLVYKRTGTPCKRCKTPIERVIIATRSSHFCPTCQK